VLRRLLDDLEQGIETLAVTMCASSTMNTRYADSAGA